MTDEELPAPRDLGENGQFVYHYTSRAAAFEHILRTGSLRLSSLATMRDPLENKERAEHVLAPLAWSAADVEKLKQLERDTLANTKVLSLTIDRVVEAGISAPHARGYARPRMWEQYAETHAGVCLVFDRALLHKTVMSRLEAINLTAWGEVIYSDLPLTSYPQARTLDASSLTEKGDGDTSRGYRMHLQENADELFFRKVEDWSTERELRYLLLDDNDDVVTVPYEQLHAVVLGERFPRWQLPGAAALCEEVGAKVLRITWRSVPTLTPAGD